jgi:hypothetical protein
MSVIAAGAIGNYGRIDYLATTNTFPGVEDANIVMKFFREHFPFAFGAFHLFTPPWLRLSSIEYDRFNRGIS